VELTDYPLYDNAVIVPDDALLDELAVDYLAGLGGAPAEMERFLFGTLSIEVFNRIFADRAEADTGALLWMLHLSGYFGGRWLRGEIAAAQPDALLVSFSQEPTEGAFRATVASAHTALTASAGSDGDALAYAAGSLANLPATEEGGAEKPGLTDNFGYNQGYMLQILEAPPEGVNSNPAYQISCSPALFDCRYATPRLEVLGRLADVQASIAAAEPPYTELVATLLPLQQEAIPRGREVWNGGLSVQGFSQPSYDQLLDVSSSYLEAVQGAAVTMAQAAAEHNVGQARVGALANAAMIVWLDAYMAGLTNGEGEIVLPEFA
jgi:hypothetical protein